MTITKNLNEKFGIIEADEDNFPVIESETKSIEGELVRAHKEEDFDLARQTLIDLLHKSTDLLDDCILLAKESQSPRAGEVAANLIKTTSDVAKDLIALHEPKQGKGAPKEAPSELHQTQNNTYYLSTNELQSMLLEAQPEDKQ